MRAAATTCGIEARIRCTGPATQRPGSPPAVSRPAHGGRRMRSFIVITGPSLTTMAATATRFLDGDFPHGRFHADLGGYSPRSPAQPSAVLRRFLHEGGIGYGHTEDASLAELARSWQACTTRRRISVFLEDAATAAQVRCLLPGPGPAVVVVTARRRLAFLPGEQARVIGVSGTGEPSREASSTGHRRPTGGPGPPASWPDPKPARIM
jgi:sugar/nucleoside kinase (ribokinase family)